MIRKDLAAAVAAVTIGLLLAWVALLVGQTPLKNPVWVVFTISSDHATIDKYTIGFFQSGAALPVQQTDLGKGTPNAQQEVQFPVPSYPIGVTYTARVKAVQGAAESDWSNESVPFVRTPGPPSGLVVK